MPDIYDPRNRNELFLDGVRTGEPDRLPDPRTRIELYLKAIAELTGSVDGKSVKVVAGAIRNIGSGWTFIENATHGPIGVDSVSVSGGRIIIKFNFEASKVVSFIIVPDETFASLYTVGASVDTDKANVEVYSAPRTIGGYISYNGSSWDTSLSDFTGGTWVYNCVRLSHESFAGYPAASRYMISVAGRDCVAIASGSDSDYVDVKFLDSSNNIKTTQDTNMKAYVTRTIPPVLLDASTITAGNGNFWFYGIMEI